MPSDKLVRDLERKHGWTRDFVEALTPYYVATLTHMSKGHDVPVYDIVDKMWHAHILRTRDYADFCAANFGRFIHHESYHDDDGHEPKQLSADFFHDYGLSLQGLQDVVSRMPDRAARQKLGAAGPTIALALAKCEPPAPPRPGVHAASALAPAKCESPAPPRQPVANMTSALAVAKCEQPDQPIPPTWAGGRA